MSSIAAAATFLLLGFSPAARRSVSAYPANGSSETLGAAVVWPSGKRINFGFRLECSTVSRPLTQEYADVAENGIPVIKWADLFEDGTDNAQLEVSSVTERIRANVKSIRTMLRSMSDGEITISAYDTAWVGLVEDLKGNGCPQFPSSLEWIANNQLQDGSWGDLKIFSAHDRILNTLACVVALKSWNMHPEKAVKGLLFIRDNMHKLEDENAEHMPIGFEVAFPSLIEIAKKLGIEIPDDSSILQDIYDRRNLKLRRIPKDIMHKVPTTLLHSLEGMPNLDWQRLLKLKCSDGSFLFSPSSTAFALMQTKDHTCLGYLTKIVERFNGGVPNVYPVDMFEHIWAVDRLDRLGISRYFVSEIEECVNYVYRYWTDEGICWARNSRVHDIDDTAMGFRTLRLHGYHVSADVFKNFEMGGQFFCFAGQSNQAVTGMYNLYRASQVMFPGEPILDDAKKFSSEFLQEKRANNELLDKWIITKDLPGEVGYALDVPWYANLPRIETRFFLEQYGGDDDVWIGKTLYRMPYVNNNMYLELGKLDYNNCQALHQLEWRSLQRWYVECGLEEFGLSERSLLEAYFLAAATTFEPEKSTERIAWAKTAALMEAINNVMDAASFLHEFQHFTTLKYINGVSNNPTKMLARTLYRTINQLSLDAAAAHGKDICQSLTQAWEGWLVTLQGGEMVGQAGAVGEAELIVRTLHLCASNNGAQQTLFMSHPNYQHLLHLTARLCTRFRQLQYQKVQDAAENCRGSSMSGVESNKSIDMEIQELVKLVLTKSPTDDDIESDIKHTFLSVAKTFYYMAHCNQATLNSHISKVLFDRVL